MKTNKVHITLAVLALFLLIGASQSYAWQVNQHYTNNTGQTAYDLTKILGGHVTCTDTMLNLPFTQFETAYRGPFTFFHWSGGSVPPGQQGHACFSTNTPTVPPFVALWTDAGGNFIGVAGPVAYPRLEYFGGPPSVVKIQIGNEWHSWTGSKYPPQTGDTLGAYVGTFTIGDAKIAIDTVTRSLEELDSTLLMEPGLTWIDVPALEGAVAPGDIDSVSMPIGRRGPGTNVYLFFTMTGGGKQSYDVIIYNIPDPVPALTNWGLIILISLLLLSAVYILFRRRRQLA